MYYYSKIVVVTVVAVVVASASKSLYFYIPSISKSFYSRNHQFIHTLLSSVVVVAVAAFADVVTLLL